MEPCGLCTVFHVTKPISAVSKTENSTYLSSRIVCVSAHVCPRAWVRPYECLCTRMVVRGGCQVSSFISLHFIPLRHGLSLIPKLVIVACQQAPRTHLSLDSVLGSQAYVASVTPFGFVTEILGPELLLPWTLPVLRACSFSSVTPCSLYTLFSLSSLPSLSVLPAMASLELSSCCLGC